jgi:hypothetical protein
MYRIFPEKDTINNGRDFLPDPEQSGTVLFAEKDLHGIAIRSDTKKGTVSECRLNENRYLYRVTDL